jgi:hypothetical protein
MAGSSQIKSDHDDWVFQHVASTRLDCSEIVNRIAVGQARHDVFVDLVS